MPKDLAALLVDEGAASADAVARALERQRDAGGALDTALLEEGVLAEADLLPWLARAAELPAAPEAAWHAADARARRVFPSRVAERHGLAPFALDGKELALVATFPVDLALLDEISFMLSLHLAPHVGPEWRVRELIHRLYGAPLAPRFAALASAAGEAGAPAAPAAADDAIAPPPATEGAEPPPAPPPTGFGHDDSEPLEPLAAALQQALEDPSLFEDDAPPETADSGAHEEAGEAEEERPPPDRSAPPRWSRDDARAALAAARDRDEVVLAAIRYARDFFEYAAVFAVTRDAIAGHDALGDHDERDRARAVAIWASDPGIFKTAIETRAPYLGPVSRDAAGNEAILSGLGRETPRTVLLYPVLLRDRPVCVVYADNGEAPVSARRLGDLLLFLSGVGAAFERIIQDRKKRGKRRRRPVPPPSREPGTPEPSASPPEPAGRAAAEPPPPEPVAPPAAVEEQEAPAPAEAEAPRAAEPAAPVPDPDPVPDIDVEIPEDLPPFDFEPPPAAVAPAASGRSASTFDDLEEAFFSSGAPSPLPPAPEPPASPALLARPVDTPLPVPVEPVAPPPAPAPAPRDAAPPPAAAADAHADGPPPLAGLAEAALDPDGHVSAAACDALAARRRDPGLRTATEKLRRALLSGLSGRATKAARALGAVRDAEAIPLLIQVLETSEPETARASAEALAAVTLQRLGPDPRKWLAWWKENRGRGRAEWLFSGLTSPDRETRVAAAVELSLAAPPPVAYSADLPPAEREKTARAWAGWWARSGHVL